MIMLDTPDLGRIHSNLKSNMSFCLPFEDDDSDLFNQFPGSIKLGPVELVTPLDYLTQLFVGHEGFYKTITMIDARVKGTWSNLSIPYREKIGNDRVYFSPTSNNLTGFIVEKTNKGNRPLIAIMSDEEDRTRAIGLGAYGSKPRKFDSVENFIIENKILYYYLNSLISVVYAEKSRRMLTGPHLLLSPN